MPNFGYTDPSASARGGLGGGIGAPHATAGAPIQLLPNQPIGIQPAKPPAQQAQHGGPRLPSFLKGISEARPGGGLPEAAGGEAAAGGAAEAGGADAIAELAPLALAAL